MPRLNPPPTQQVAGRPRAPAFGGYPADPSVSAEHSALSLEGLRLSDEEGPGEGATARFEPSASHPFARLTASVFPARAATANLGSLPLGAAVDPFSAAADAEAPLRIPRDPARCVDCAAFLNGYCRVDTARGRWRCCFCGGDNADAALAAGPGEEAPLRHRRELFEPDVTYAVASHSASERSAEREPEREREREPEPEPSSTPVVFVVDESLDEDEAESLRASLEYAARAAPPDAPTGLVSYGAAVAAHEIRPRAPSSGGASSPLHASAEIVPGTRSPTPEDVAGIVGEGPAGIAARFLASAADGGEDRLDAALASLRPFARDSAASRVPARERPRCLGAAIETAAMLVPDGGRLVVCAGGPPTRGPGGVVADDASELVGFQRREAAEYFDQLADALALVGVSVDVIAGGREAARESGLARLAEATGGAFVVEDDFGASFAENVAAAARRPAGRRRGRSTLTVRTPPGVRVTRVVGPAEAVAEEEKRAATETAAVAGKAKADASVAFALAGDDPSRGVVFFFEYDGDLPGSFAPFQFVLWRDEPDLDGSSPRRSARCVTLRVPTTPSDAAYLRAVDGELAAVLAAKKAALDASDARTGAALAADVAEARVVDVADAFESVAAAEAAAAAASDRGLRAFPSALAPFAEAMYHLVRGPMLGRVMGHEDERRAARRACADASSRVAAAMLVPRAHAWLGGDAFERVPPADLSLWASPALVLDHGTAVFVWTRRDVDERVARDATLRAERFASALRRGRFPVPRVRVVREGSSAARYVLARVTPNRRDAESERTARCPAWGRLAEEERRRAVAEAPPTEEPSFNGWMRELGLKPPPPTGGGGG